MRKYSIGFIFIVLILASVCAASTEPVSGAVEFRYFFMREVPETVSDIYFTNTVKQKIDACPLDVDLGLNNPQLYSAILHNVITSSYSITLTFNALLKAESQNIYGYYEAQVYKLDAEGNLIAFDYNNSDTRIIDVCEEHPARSVVFNIDHTADSNSKVFYYPIAFRFSKYLEDYSMGVYSGIIRIEVAPSS